MSEKNEKKILEIISNETKDSINQLNIVTPSIYASIFSKYAYEHDEVIDNEKDLALDLLKTECTVLTQMQEQAAKSADKLTKHTDKAITAIKEKDESTLSSILEETQALRSELEKLKEAVYKDELTHSYNRKWLHDTYLDDKGSTFNRNGVLAIIDLNYFKLVNDSFGHIIGDKVLIFIANQLKATHFDVVRYGGDEFIILFPPEITPKKAENLLNELREKVITKKLKAHDTMFRASFSIGIEIFKKEDELATVINNADKKMYADKESIKQRITNIEV